MKKTIYFAVVVVTLAFSAWMLLRWWSRDPSAAFKRHFHMWPPVTVREIVRGGSTALASGDEYLVFSGTPNDIKQIIHNRKFEYVGVAPQNSKYLDRAAWRGEVHQAERRGVSAERLYETGIEGAVYYVLITNADSTKVFYHYVK